LQELIEMEMASRYSECNTQSALLSDTNRIVQMAYKKKS